MKSTYSEPTVLWRLRSFDGREAHAVIVPRWRDASTVWFIDGSPEGAKDFASWERAVEWLTEVETQFVTEGWISCE